jgi:thiaminase/transcriptional activator TenA
MYTDPEYAALAQAIQTLADRIASHVGRDETASMEEAYLTSMRLEYRFWEMAYTLEGWGV